MAVPGDNTSAYFLHELLVAVRESDEPYISGAWSKALDAPFDSWQFAKRHGEVVNLFKETVEGMDALPERTRLRLERYVNAWWIAVVGPQSVWNNNQHPPARVIDDTALDQLGSAADLLSLYCAGSAVAPAAANLDQLREACADWLDLLQNLGPEELPDALKLQLVAQLQHLIWLIEISPLVGGARVAQEASRFVGALANTAATAPNGSPARSSTWREKLGAFLGVLVLFTAGVEASTAAIDAGQGAVTQVEELIEGGTGD